MTWTKISDSVPDDPRLLRLPRDVRWMHLEGMVWCNRHATDGHVPAYALHKVTDQEEPEKAASQLVDVGLWSVDNDGWLIVTFADDQPSAADQERAREYDRQRQRRQRLHKTGDHRECEPRYCREASRVTHRVSDGVSHGSPSRPDPTRPEGEGSGRDERAAGSAPDGRSASAPRAASAPPAEPPMAWTHLDPPPGTVTSINGVPIVATPGGEPDEDVHR